ncbi:hypothetical protein [Mycobacteroides abscessus]|uniref:hypothetical protein n=1 Tax=Mycobacteroides abscessus TaxID=36809 RepID=UPI0009A6D7BE|nr:hypothetical protein [Mycobacteroides abscessus]SLI42452.1 Uncharacterised protein [Mycobacteroides abscessus subsp. abscessus]
MPDIQRPADDPYNLVQGSWPAESETAYTVAEAAADDASTTASTRSAAADDAARQTSAEMQGKTADAVSDGYDHAATQLSEQSRNFTTIAGWMGDAAGKVSKAKNNIASLVMTGTSEICVALDSELRGTPVSPSSNELTDKYRGEITAAATQLTDDLDSIGHSLAGDPGSSRTPTYVRASSTPTTPTVEQSVHQGITGESQALAVEPHQLPVMPRATTSSNTESPSGTSTPSAPTHSVNPTLAHLVGGQGTSTGTPSAASPGGTSSPHAPSSSTPAVQGTQAHQPTEQHQAPRPAALPHIPSIPLDGLPLAAAESIATVVSSATAHQLPTAPSTPAPSVPASTGFTPGVPGTSPVTPVTPAPLSPIGGGGLTTPTVTQPVTPAPQGTPAAPPAASQQTAAPQQTTTPRSPAADLSWIQRTYGLAPGVEVPKSESVALPAPFIVDLPESEAHLHRVLGTIRQEFEQGGWTQPLAAATLRRGFETKLVFVTADAISIHPSGVLLPHGVLPLDEMPTVPVDSRLAGSLVVTDKLTALIPREWTVEGLLSTVPSDENHQSAEQYQSLVESEELLPCTVLRGRGDVEAGEAMSLFARAAIGSAGCGKLDAESARLRGARWVGVQPVDYLYLLRRWYLADAAECMSEGRWGEAVYASKKYQRFVDTKYQAA